MCTPLFARARENARKANCQSNLKQIGNAILMYAGDYDGMLPDLLVGRDTNVPAYYTWWYNNLTPYIKNTGVFKCPSMEWNSWIGYGAVREVWGYAGSLGFNAAQWAPYSNPDAPGYGQPLDAMTVPAENILVVDGTYPTCQRDFWMRTDNASSPTTAIAAKYNNAYYVVDSRHSEGANAVFADGHVKWMKQGIVGCPITHSNPGAGAGNWHYYQFH